MSLNNIFVKNITAIMKEKGMSGLELARKSGVARSHIAKILNNGCGVTLSSAERLCWALNVEPALMMEE